MSNDREDIMERVKQALNGIPEDKIRELKGLLEKRDNPQVEEGVVHDVPCLVVPFALGKMCIPIGVTAFIYANLANLSHKCDELYEDEEGRFRDVFNSDDEMYGRVIRDILANMSEYFEKNPERREEIGASDIVLKNTQPKRTNNPMFG